LGSRYRACLIFKSQMNHIKRFAVALEGALEADLGRRLFDEADDDGASQLLERVVHGLRLEKALREGAVPADFAIKHTRQVIKKFRLVGFAKLRAVPGIERLRRRRIERKSLLAASREVEDIGCALGAQVDGFDDWRIAEILNRHGVC